MNWSLDKLVSLTKRFNEVEDEDLSLMLDRLQELEGSYKMIERCCESVHDFSVGLTSELASVRDSLKNLESLDLGSDNCRVFRAHVENMASEYDKFVKTKVEMEITELLLTDLTEKRRIIEEFRKRISLCAQSDVSYKEMFLHYSQLKKQGDDVVDLQEECEKQKNIVEQQKLQLNSDIHFLLEKEKSFIEHNMDIILRMMQRSVCHNESLFRKEPPKYILNPDAPFVDGKEDSEIDFVVKAGGFHILPLSMKKGREIMWAIHSEGGDIGFRVSFRGGGGDDKKEGSPADKISKEMTETIVDPLHLICTSGSVHRGSYCGVEYGMVELLFDNTHAFLRSKKIHVRLGTKDEVEHEVEAEAEIEIENGSKDDHEMNVETKKE